ncbi:hypothetical protein B0H19DRAFT_480943 [Mycena capillaripes]|nr:hypothetical protein B0H19DRAFT_480943 [Mycena capillaripes]
MLDQQQSNTVPVTVDAIGTIVNYCGSCGASGIYSIGLATAACYPSPRSRTVMQYMYIVDSDELDSSWDLMIRAFFETGASLLLYGIYFNLFILSIHTLSRRRPHGVNILIVASCAMALLGTAQVAVTLATCGMYCRVPCS